MSDSPVLTPALALLLEELTGPPMILPGEDPAMYEGLRQALLRDLAPRTPYEKVLTENMVMLEWEAFRHRRMRDDLIKAKARDLAIGASATGEVKLVLRGNPKQQTLGSDLVGADLAKSTSAAAALQEQNISLGEILAKAYSQVSGQVDRHEKKLAEIETRRRRLKEDYDRLRAARPKPVEDAEIIG